MTTVELKTAIVADLDQMNIEMLERVSLYVRRLRRHVAPSVYASDEASDESLGLLGTHKTISDDLGILLAMPLLDETEVGMNGERVREDYYKEKYA